MGVAGGRKPVIPDFVLLGLIGRGSYGDVWLARSLTGVYRAIKVIHRDRFADAAPFDREFNGLKQFAAMVLPDAGLLALLHAGQNAPEGYFYYVMELADDVHAGRAVDPERYQPLTLRELRDQRGRLSAAECVAIAVDLARAVAALHLRGLVHRDIKPSNIIMVGGRPKLADIGLVAAATEARTFVGTEGYVPPEGPGKPSADVYALGKVIYELSTGLKREDYPRLPEDLRALADRSAIVELNEVVLAACDPIVPRRYPDATHMLADLLVLEAGHSLVRRNSRANWAKRVGRPALAAGMALGVLGWWWWSVPRLPAAPSEASQLVGRAWAQLNKPDVGRAEIEFADGLCQRACELEPFNAEAWAAWSQVNSLACGREIDVTPARREAARVDLERALTIAPDSPEVRLAQACYLARLEMRSFAPEAQRILRQLLSADPNEPRALREYADVEEGLGRAAPAKVALSRLTRNPRFAPQAWLMLAHWATDHNGGDGYVQALDRSIAAQPFSTNLSEKLEWLEMWQGDLDAAAKLVDETPAAVLQSDAMLPQVFRLYYLRREGDRAVDFLNGISRDWMSGDDGGPISYFKGQAYALAGRDDLARIEWMRAMRLVEERRAVRPTNRHLMAIKVRLFVFLGDFGAAGKALEVEEEARRGIDWSSRFALVVAEGKLDEAMDIFQQGKPLHHFDAYAAQLRLDPRFDPLRKNARFQAELAQAAADPRRSPQAAGPLADARK